MNASQNGSRNGRYPLALRSTENYQQSNRYVPASMMPQLAGNFLPKTPVVLNGSLRNKSANTTLRQPSGLFS